MLKSECLLQILVLKRKCLCHCREGAKDLGAFDDGHGPESGRFAATGARRDRSDSRQSPTRGQDRPRNLGYHRTEEAPLSPEARDL